MTNSPKDLDQASVVEDARNALEHALETALDDTDGADLGTILTIISDAGGYDSYSDALEHDRIMRDIVNCTQSNSDRSWTQLREFARLLDIDPDTI